MRPRGILITLEGGDGTGKSTHQARLVSYLRSRGYSVVATREPGGTRIGEAIRDVLLSRKHTKLAPLTELTLMYAARAQHIEEVIRPALERGRIVVSDRYNDASLAYQGFGRGLGSETVRALDRMICGDIQPDLTILLDLQPRTALERTRNRRSGRSRFEAEGLRFQERVRAAYLAIARTNPARVVIIDAGGSRESIEAEIRNTVSRWIEQRAGGTKTTGPLTRIRRQKGPGQRHRKPAG